MTINASYDQNGNVSAILDGVSHSIPSEAIQAMDGRVPEQLKVFLRAGNIIQPYLAPPVTADRVRAEAQRRIIILTGASDLNSCVIKQLNALMRVGEINDKQARGEALTPQEQAEAVALRNMAAMVKAIRAASNVMEPNPPADYTSNARWPA